MDIFFERSKKVKTQMSIYIGTFLDNYIILYYIYEKTQYDS